MTLEQIFRLNEIRHDKLYQNIDAAIRQNFMASDEYKALCNLGRGEITYKYSRSFDIIGIERTMIVVKEKYGSMFINKFGNGEWCEWRNHYEPDGPKDILFFNPGDIKIDNALFIDYINCKETIRKEIKPFYEKIVGNFNMSEYAGYEIATQECQQRSWAKSPNVIRYKGIMFVEHTSKKGNEYEAYIYLMPFDATKLRLEILIP